MAGTFRNAIRNHWQRIEDAIRTGDMKKVKSANRTGYNQERREVRNYGTKR